jgi:3-oxoisoapionate kinase
VMLYTYYGDDFTGSTDVLETLALAGVKAALFLAPPGPRELSEFPGLQAIGIAGDSRSRSPEWMSANLGEIFGTMKAFGAPVTHYKTCSTFDSAPNTGSIGRAMELGIETFGGRFVPVVVGAPHLGRYVVFGNLFAIADGIAYRIDRHPTMNRHPVTPMLEADLRRHLALQTALPIGLVDLRNLSRNGLDTALQDGAAAVLFDTFDDVSLKTVGELVWESARVEPLFAVGSSGLTESLIPAWRKEGSMNVASTPVKARKVEQILVLSGSCSPVTAGQIEWGLTHGFEGIALDAAKFISDPTRIVSQVLSLIRKGASPILYTAMGPLTSNAKPHAEELGIALGQLLRVILEQSDVRRLVLCGGDTSSHAVQQLPVQALTWAAGLARGAPLCKAHAPGSHMDGLELVLKGGQVGDVDFFGMVKG